MSKTTRLLYFTLLVTGGAAILIYCFSGGISGNDFWWHVKAGEWICANKSVPDRDLFSWYGTTHDFKWLAHEWLAEVILWRCYSAFGEAGIFLSSLLAAIAMTVLLAFQIREQLTENCLVAGFYICMFCVVSSVFFYGRPQIFAFFLLYGELYCLYEYLNGRKKWCIWLIPLIACLWSNLHGGSSNLSYLLVLVVLFGGIWDWKLGRIYGEKWTVKQMVQLLAVLVVAMGAVCVNPAGAEIFAYPYTNMADQLMLGLISEWAAPDAKKLGQLINYFIPVLVLCSGMVFGKQKVKAADALLMLLFLLLFFRSARFIIWLYISGAFWAFPYMLPCRLKNVEKMQEKLMVFGVELALIAACGVGLATCLDTYKSGNLISRVLEEEMLDTIRKDAPSRLFNDYNYGGALIDAGLPVFLDERADVYAQDHLLADGVSLMLLQQLNTDAGTVVFDPEELIAKYGFDAFLVDMGRPLYSYLSSHGDRYKEVMTAGDAAYFVVVSPEAD